MMDNSNVVKLNIMTVKLNKFPNRIREVRNRFNKTQKQVAEGIGVDPVHISNLETGRRHPSLPMLRSIAHFLGVDTIDLLAEHDNPFGSHEEISDLSKLWLDSSEEGRNAILRVAESFGTYRSQPKLKDYKKDAGEEADAA